MTTNLVYHVNIETETLKNNNFRKVLHTNHDQQLVIMCIKPADDIPLEMHNDHDQLIRIEEGLGQAIIGQNQDHIVDLSTGSLIMIPSGTWHRIVNISQEKPLKLYSLYSPPEHPIDRIDISKPISGTNNVTNNTKKFFAFY